MAITKACASEAGCLNGASHPKVKMEGEHHLGAFSNTKNFDFYSGQWKCVGGALRSSVTESSEGDMKGSSERDPVGAVLRVKEHH